MLSHRFTKALMSDNKSETLHFFLRENFRALTNPLTQQDLSFSQICSKSNIYTITLPNLNIMKHNTAAATTVARGVAKGVLYFNA